MRRAWPSFPMTEMNWSMIPQGIPANWCSAFWQANALSFWGLVFPSKASKKVYVATSKEAELDTPPPRGTDVHMTASKELTSPEITKLTDNRFYCK